MERTNELDGDAGIRWMGRLRMPPVLSALRSPKDLLVDALAGVTVGLVSIPQAVAFAVVAGVPAEVALATMVVPGLGSLVCRKSAHLAPGATNTGALLTGAVLISDPLRRELGVLPLLSALCVIVGIAHLAVGLTGLGRLARYVSPAVVLGFTCGAAGLLILGQLPMALGAINVAAAPLPHVDALAASIALLTLLAIAALDRWRPALPAPLLALFAATLAMYAVGADVRAQVALLGELRARVPDASLPTLQPSALASLAPAGLAIALVGMTELVSIGKSLALRTHRGFPVDRELCAQGAANLAAACFPCMPSSVSWTRSSASLDAGARTPAAIAFASLTVLLAVLLLAPAARFVPMPAVAAVVIWIALRMIRIDELRRVLRANRGDIAVIGVTAALTLTVDLYFAVFAGVALSLGLVVRRASLLRLQELRHRARGHYVEHAFDEATGRTTITLLQAEGDLFFAVADELEARLRTVAQRGTRGIVLRLKRTLAIDEASAAALARFATWYAQRGGAIVICGLRPELHAAIERTELAAVLGRDALLETGGRPYRSLELALEQLRRTLALSRDEAASLRESQVEVAEAESWSI